MRGPLKHGGPPQVLRLAIRLESSVTWTILVANSSISGLPASDIGDAEGAAPGSKSPFRVHDRPLRVSSAEDAGRVPSVRFRPLAMLPSAMLASLAITRRGCPWCSRLRPRVPTRRGFPGRRVTKAGEFLP
jgi:hypothetical protein